MASTKLMVQAMDLSDTTQQVMVLLGHLDCQRACIEGNLHE